MWTKAHVGNTGNERADTLAKEGACSDADPMIAAHVPQSYEANLIKGMIQEQWMQEWTEYPHARQTKQFFPSLNPQTSKKIMSPSRRGVGHVVRLVSGHNNLNYHNFIRDPEGTVSKFCRFCNECEETFYHFITNCPVFSDLIEETFLKTTKGPT